MRKGFTVIELMIVMAIIGIFATVAYPAFKSRGKTALPLSDPYTPARHPTNGLSCVNGMLYSPNSAGGLDPVQAGDKHLSC